MDSQLSEIKDKLNVVDIVGSYVKLTKAGTNFRGICPFHSEKSPSFFVSPTRQMWHCFGCGAGSSIFDFVMKIEGVEFGDALRILANKAGVTLKRENVQLRTERQKLYEICELAAKFFEKQLEGSAIGNEAKNYLLKRGINQESILKWRIGYSPDTWSGLSDFLISKGYLRQEIIKAGLAIEKEQNKSDSYDRFRGRIMFPIFDVNSQVVGFGGRVFKDADKKDLPAQAGTAKYINTPQTLLYDKSGILYGLHNAKLAIRKQNQCVVTEGYTDVIMCHQAGFENTVAASGTALTRQHVTLLKRYSENLVLAFDMDMAGDSATRRGINLAEAQGFNIKIIETYDKNSDPADVILKDVKLWEESLAKAKSIMDYYIDTAFLMFDKSTPNGKKEIGRLVLPAVKRLQNKIEQSFWVQTLSQKLQIKEEAILEELAKIQSDPNLQIHPNDTNTNAKTDTFELNKNVGEAGRKKLIEEKIISLILKNPNYVKTIEDLQYELFSEKTALFLKEVAKIVNLEKVPDQEELVKDFNRIFEQIAPDAQFNNFLAALALRADLEEDNEQELKLCLLQLKNIALKDKLELVSEEIKKAEAEKNLEKVKELVEKFNMLTKEL